MSEGFLQLRRTVDSIRIGERVRQDLGDIDELVESIRQTGGPLQPITISPDGWLICGLRRLEAVKRLGMTVIDVWVRTGITTQLERLLAEYHENTMRKPLTLVEAGQRFRELLAITKEDAQRRQLATRFGAEPDESVGAGKLPAPTGRAADQAAAIIGMGRRTLEKIATVLDAADDPTVDPTVREVATQQRELMATGQVRADPAHRAVRAAQDETTRAALDAVARAKAARLRPVTARAAGERTPPADPRQLSPRAFMVMLAETDYWWLYYDQEELAARLTPASWEHVAEWHEQSSRFLTELLQRRRMSA